jgi:hypothetical protein
MLRRTTIAAIAISAVLAAGAALAQSDCTVGAYVDLDGTESFYQPLEGEVFSVYVILFTEDFANAVSYGLSIPGYNQPGGIFDLGFEAAGPFADLEYFPAGGALWVRTGLGECVIGFLGTPILVARHDLLVDVGGGGVTLTMGPDPREDPNFPLYSTCQQVLIPCGRSDLSLGDVIATDSASWGQVKALYSN